MAWVESCTRDEVNIPSRWKDLDDSKHLGVHVSMVNLAVRLFRWCEMFLTLREAREK